MKPRTNRTSEDGCGLDHCHLETVLGELANGDFQSRWEAAKQLPQFGTAAIPALVALLQTELAAESGQPQDWELLWFIARILGSLNHPTAVELLVKLLQSTQDPDILAIATAALANMGEAALPALGDLLSRSATRLIAVQALGQLQTPAVVPLLLEAATDARAEIRVAVLEALNSFVGEPISSLLWSSLQDESAAVRRTAVAALGLQVHQQNAERLVAALQPLLSDGSLDVACQTALALGRLGSGAAIHLLAEALGSASTPLDLKLEIVRALAWTENSAALAHLQTYLMAHSQSQSADELCLTQELIAVLGRVAAAPMRAAASQILLDLLQANPALLQTLAINQQIALSLGQLGEISALDPLIGLLATPDLRVRLHTIAALKQFDPQAVHSQLTARLAAADSSAELKTGIQLALKEWSAPY